MHFVHQTHLRCFPLVSIWNKSNKSAGLSKIHHLSSSKNCHLSHTRNCVLETSLSLYHYNGLLSSRTFHQCISNWGRCSSQQPSLPLKVMCHQRSSAIEKVPPSIHLPPLMSSVQFGKGPGKQSSRPCTTASHYQSHLPTFVFAFSFPPLSFFHLVSL